MEYEISKIDPISLGKISAIMYAVIGIVMLLVYAPFMLILAGLQGGTSIVVTIVGGIVFGIFGIVFYAGLGFVFGMLSGYLYNYAASKMGGIGIDLKER